MKSKTKIGYLTLSVGFFASYLGVRELSIVLFGTAAILFGVDLIEQMRGK
jgi:hypothetical protein